MLINDVQNVKEIPPIIINELKELGVKCRKEKKIKIIPDKTSRKRIFRTHLHQLELTDVVLANGGIVQIPQFVSEICQRILENVEVEGLFRKAGSSIRQREIKENLESGLPLRKTYHVIDIANVLKSFFRELPESLLPNSSHDTLIRCLLISDGRIRIKAILMSCLLLPNITINTLAFFMQFLNTIALNSHLNKMSIDNLAIIFTPGLMPAVIPDKSGIRFNNHVKVIRILIENSDMIGILPDSILKKINSEPKMMIASISSQELPQQQQKEGKKKKRRSGSLTRMFSGIRKIVGVIGSSDSLDTTPVQSNENIIVTPCLSKSAKKRKLENNFAFSNKKRKEIFDSIPSGNGGLLPNTPLCLKEIKKNRLSLGGKKHFKDQLTDKRWSIVGSNWTRKKEKMTWNGIKKSTISVMNTESNSNYQQVLCPVMSTPNMSTNLEDSMNKNNLFCNKNSKSASNLLISKKHDDDDDENNEVSDNSDYVKVSKREYEAIKKRVAAIETKISQEFSTTTMSLYNSSATSVASSSSSSSMSPNSITSVFNINYDQNKRLSGPEKVLNKFEKTIEETENISSSSSSATTDHLAKRLSRELKIRRSIESNVFRSPSQRKIVSIRRRSRERIRLTRNKTWHVSSRKENVKDLTQNDENGTNDTTFVAEIDNLKRNLKNTLQINSLEPSTTTTTTIKITKSEIEDLENKENWISGEQFFNTFNDDQEIIENIPITSIPSTTVQTTTKPFHSMQIHIQQQQPTTPKFITRIAVNEVKTPMLPPKLIPRKTPMNIKTPVSKMTPNSVSKKLISTPNLEETQNGRASIVRLRALNAGMVLAKAKLFDGLGNETSENQIIQNDHILNKNENRRKSRQFTTIPNRMRSSEPESDFRKEINGGGLNRIEKLKENDHQLQSFSRKSKTPTRKKTGTPQHNLVNQKRSQLSIVASGSSNVGGSGGNNNKIGERILLEKFMNEKQIQTKGNRNKVTSIRNISNNNSDNNNKKHTPRKRKN